MDAWMDGSMYVCMNEWMDGWLMWSLILAVVWYRHAQRCRRFRHHTLMPLRFRQASKSNDRKYGKFQKLSKQ